jgi:hypothetical protein
MGTLSRVVYCLLVQTSYDWPKAFNACVGRTIKKNREKHIRRRGKILGKGNPATGMGHNGAPGLRPDPNPEPPFLGGGVSSTGKM